MTPPSLSVGFIKDHKRAGKTSFLFLYAPGQLEQVNEWHLTLNSEGLVWHGWKAAVLEATGGENEVLLGRETGDVSCLSPKQLRLPLGSGCANAEGA